MDISKTKKRILNIVGILCSLGLLACVVVYICWVANLEQYPAENNSGVLGIDYDMQGQPMVYKMEGLAWRKIWEYEGQNYTSNPTYSWEIQWIDDRNVMIVYQDGPNVLESYPIVVPEDYARMENENLKR